MVKVAVQLAANSADLDWNVNKQWRQRGGWQTNRRHSGARGKQTDHFLEDKWGTHSTGVHHREIAGTEGKSIRDTPELLFCNSLNWFKSKEIGLMSNLETSCTSCEITTKKTCQLTKFSKRCHGFDSRRRNV